MENDHKKKGTEKNECRVKFQGDWFSISKFTDKHPGGIDVLQKVSGVDIEQFLSGESAVDGVKHKHSQNGYRILKKYAENQNVSKAEIGLVDLDKPVMSQIGRLGGKYWDWIHSPVDKDLRMFESDWLEFLTRNQWYIIPTLWMPLVLALSWIAFRLFTREENGNCFSALVIVALYFAFGIFVWSMMEYLLHRFAFHWKPPADSPSLIIFHFILHGLHHKTPMDGGRLVFPPPMAACMILLFFIVYQYLLRWPVCLAIGSGNLFGYICYDLTHYYLHHGLPSLGSYMHGLKGYHHAHHFKNPDLGRLFTIGMYLRYYLDEDGNRIYTLKKISPSGKPTSSAHPAKFSPEDQYSRQRIIIKRRFGLLPTQQAKPTN